MAPKAIHATVRDAAPEDGEAIRAIAGAAWRDTYAGLLRPETIETFIERAYSVDRIDLRIARDTFLVAELDGRIVAFVDAIATETDVNVAAIYALPEDRGQGAGTQLLADIAARSPGLPIRADVLDGNRKGEVFYERRGFVPRERLEDELFGEPVVERRWWLDPSPASRDARQSS